MQQLYGTDGVHPLLPDEIKGPASLGFPPIDRDILRKLYLAIGELKGKMIRVRRHSAALNPRQAYALGYYSKQISQLARLSNAIRGLLTERGFRNIQQLILIARAQVRTIRWQLETLGSFLDMPLAVGMLDAVEMPPFGSLCCLQFIPLVQARGDSGARAVRTLDITNVPMLSCYNQLFQQLCQNIEQFQQTLHLSWQIAMAVNKQQKAINRLCIEAISRNQVSGPWDL